MKYKVIFIVSFGSGNRGAANAEFYVYDEAQNACEQWRQLGSAYSALLWDGATWTNYAPIP